MTRGLACRKLMQRFRREGHLDAAKAVDEMDLLMRSYGFTEEALTADGEALGRELRALVAEWIERR